MPIEVYVHCLVLVRVNVMFKWMVDLPWLVAGRLEDERSGSELNIGSRRKY